MRISQKLKKFARNTIFSTLVLSGLTIPYKTMYSADSSTPNLNKLENLLEELPAPAPVVKEKTNEPVYDKTKRAYRIKGTYETNGLGINTLENSDEYYLFSDGRVHNDSEIPYVSAGQYKLVIGAPINQRTPLIELLPGNPYLDVKKNNFVMILGFSETQQGSMRIERMNWDKKIPRITAYASGYNIFNGQKGIEFNEEIKRTNKGPEPITENPISAPGKIPIPLHVVTADKIGQRLDGFENSWDIVFDRFGNITRGTSRELESYPGSVRFGQYTSIRESFHELTFEEQEAMKRREIAKALKKLPIKLHETIPLPPKPYPINEPLFNLLPLPPAPYSNYPEHLMQQGMSGGDGLEPDMPYPRILGSNVMCHKGEKYYRISPNIYKSRSGKVLKVN